MEADSVSVRRQIGKLGLPEKNNLPEVTRSWYYGLERGAWQAYNPWGCKESDRTE